MMRLTTHASCSACSHTVLLQAVLLGGSCVAAMPAFAQQVTTPLAIPDALSAGQLADRTSVALSADGEWVAYTVQYPQRVTAPGDARHSIVPRTSAASEALGGDIWVANVHTGQAINVSAGRGSSWAPAWSPDGHTLAFYSDRDGLAHVWLWDRGAGHLRRLSDAVVRTYFTFEGPRWTPDGRAVVTKVLPTGMSVDQLLDLGLGPAPRAAPVAADSPTVTVYRAADTDTSRRAPRSREAGQHDSTGKHDVVNIHRADLALIDVHAGVVRRIARNVRPRGYWLSPDGSQLAYTSILGWEETTQQPYFDLFVTSIRDGATHLAAHKVPMSYGISVSWSPDGTTLAYLTGSEDGPLKGDCLFVRPSGGAPISTAHVPHADFSADYRQPLWDSAGHAVFVLGADTLWRVDATSGAIAAAASVPGHTLREIVAPAGVGRFASAPGGHALYVTTRDDSTKRDGIYRVDLTARSVSRVSEDDVAYGDEFSIDVSADGRTVVYATQDAQHPEDLQVADGAFENRRRLTHIAPSLDGHVFGATRLLCWRSADGRPLKGVLLLPTGYTEGRRYPLIVNLYGGSLRSNALNRFGVSGPGVENMQLFATRGYAMLLPDAPIDQTKHVPMAEIAKTVLPGVTEAVEVGVADPARLGVMGHSYGGYSTLSLLVQSTMFKAAMASGSIGDLVADYGAMLPDGTAGSVGWAEHGQGDMGGTPWEFRDRYLENSPFFYLDRVRTPVLLVHGALDLAVPVALGEQTFVALRRLGQEVELARYAGEGHWEGAWGYPNRVDYWQRMLRWFDDHLQPTEPGSAASSP